MYILPNVSFTPGVASSFVPFQDELNTIKAVSGYGRDVVMLDSDPFILPTTTAEVAPLVGRMNGSESSITTSLPYPETALIVFSSS